MNQVTDHFDVVERLEARAIRHETPCGAGSMAWRQWGSGPPLVLLHGSQGAWIHWIRNIEALAQQFTVLALDLPGHGDSAALEEMSHDRLSATIAAGLEHIRGADGLPVRMAGFSLGGVIGAHCAARFPALISQIVIVGSGGLGTPVGVFELARARGLEGDERQAVLRSNLLALMLSDPASVDALALAIQDWNRSRERVSIEGLVLPDKLLDALPAIRCPISLIWGEKDQPHPHPAIQHAAACAVRPDISLSVVPDAGHWAMYERPEAFNRALINCLT
jgi:pimeloyl-ACP methyl ester carboxylesterase